MFDIQPDGDIHGECAEEITRLTAALKKANNQTEHFERKWYLCKDVLEDVYTRFKQYEMDVDDLPPRDHVDFMNKLKGAIDA